MEKFWFERASTYSEVNWGTNNKGTHPAIIKLIEKYGIGNKILDYGCGDGSLIEKLDSMYESTLFDISEEMLKLSRIRLANKNKKFTIVDDSNKIPENHFDYCILSMVLVCISDEFEISNIFNRLKRSKHEQGRIIIANPHPCFRQYAFEDYFTDFSIGNQMNYFESGQPHKLYIKNTDISFTDYNWPISYLINKMTKAGLQIEDMIELKDHSQNISNSQYFSPSLLFTCK